MRSFPIILALLYTLPTFGVAQDETDTCKTLAVIQSQECTVRRIFVCDGGSADWRQVGTYGPDGPVSLSTFNGDGIPLRTGTGPGTPQTRLGEQADPLSLQTVLTNGTDTFDYQLDHDDGSAIRISGKTRTTGETVIIDGRSLQMLASRQSIVNPAGETTLVDVNYLYDADLKLLITDVIRDAVTGEERQHRTPVDFMFPGEPGFEDYVPLYGCEG